MTWLLVFVPKRVWRHGNYAKLSRRHVLRQLDGSREIGSRPIDSFDDIGVERIQELRDPAMDRSVLRDADNREEVFALTIFEKGISLPT
jgi:hypothetical protein